MDAHSDTEVCAIGDVACGKEAELAPGTPSAPTSRAGVTPVKQASPSKDGTDAEEALALGAWVRPAAVVVLVSTERAFGLVWLTGDVCTLPLLRCCDPHLRSCGRRFVWPVPRAMAALCTMWSCLKASSSRMVPSMAPRYTPRCWLYVGTLPRATRRRPTGATRRPRVRHARAAPARATVATAGDCAA